MFSLVVYLAFSFQAVEALTLESESRENPIRRIVTLLQKMQSEVAAEGEKDEELNDKFVCYCKKSEEALEKTSGEAGDRIPQLEAEIETAESSKAQLDQDLEAHKADRTAAKEAIGSATAQREKEAASYADESSELKTNVDACGKALSALRDGMAGSFLQSAAAGSLRTLMETRSMDSYSQGALTEFLATSTEYAPASGEIVGIVSQLKENMEKELADATATENTKISSFEGLVAAKNKEIQAATDAIESKTARAGETAVQIVSLKNDLEDTREALADDGTFLADLKKDCALKATEYEERKALRAQETLALSETISVLNDDDALDLFKKTMASPALLQLGTRTKDIQAEALDALKGMSAKGPKMSFILMALSGKGNQFEKVIKMVDDLVATLKAEQTDDDQQKDWCAAEFDKSDDTEKELVRKIDTLSTQISETEDGIATLTDALAALVKGIKELDVSVADASEQRKEENANFVQTKAENSAALQLLEVAKNRLNKFYNPTLYKAPPARELTEEERLYVASGGVLTTAAPGGIAGTGVALPVFAQLNAAPAPAPETAAAFTKKDSSGPIALIDSIKSDLEKDMLQNDNDEAQSQKSYEEFMADSAAKRKADSRTITEKEDQKAGLEADLVAAKDAKTRANGELLNTRKYISELHVSCDFLVQNFDLRKESRASEIDALQNAKAVLSGADYSLLQTGGFLHRA